MAALSLDLAQTKLFTSILKKQKGDLRLRASSRLAIHSNHLTRVVKASPSVRSLKNGKTKAAAFTQSLTMVATQILKSLPAVPFSVNGTTGQRNGRSMHGKTWDSRSPPSRSTLAASQFTTTGFLMNPSL